MQYKAQPLELYYKLFNFTEAVMKLFKWFAVGLFFSAAAPCAFAEMIVAKGNTSLCVDMKDRGTGNNTPAQMDLRGWY